MKLRFLCFLSACSALKLFETSVNAGIPDNFESRVIVVEETEKDGNTLRVFGFDDDGIEGNIPGLR